MLSAAGCGARPGSDRTAPALPGPRGPRRGRVLTAERVRPLSGFADRLVPGRLAALVEPLAALGPGVRIAVEDADGRRLAGPDLHAATECDVLPITALGGEVGRVVVVADSSADRPGARAAAGVLAVALGALVDDAAAQAVRGDEAHAEEHVRIEAELALGRRLQRSFVPLVAPEIEGWELASHYEAAREVGGDFFDTFTLRTRVSRLAVVVADVTGKGIAAALLMAFARPLIHAAIDHARDPVEALERTNRILVEERRAALFITALCLLVDRRTGRYRLASAGHEPPLLVRPARPAVWLETSGPLLGVFPHLGLTVHEATLERGDAIVLYTDGVTDAQSPSGARFGDERLRGVVEAARDGRAGDLVAEIVEAMRRFQDGTPPADDVTLVAIRRMPAGRRVYRSLGSDSSPG